MSGNGHPINFSVIVMRNQSTHSVHYWLVSGLLLFSSFIGSFINSAAEKDGVTVYRWQSPDGSVEFSDESRVGSEAVVVEEPMVLPFLGKKPPIRKASSDEFSYASLSITTPKPEATFRNEAAFSISVTGQIEPILRRKDQLVLLLDGAVIAGPGRSRAFTLPTLERGAHTLQLEVLSAEGNRVKKSDVITIYVQRNIARSKAGG